MSVGYDLDQAVIVALAVATSRPVGYGALPGDHGSNYIIVTPFGGPPPFGDLGSRVSNKDYRYTVLSVGEDFREVRWLKDKVLARLVQGAQLLSSVQWVVQELDGAIVQDGETLFSSVDTFLVRI